ncbi:hypothetical protein [Candidatus Lokiarchaeum ossiferum]|uniref:hypothetical protein n=1 Tax=Candidatus Lokiarchaeum ossiferum TaxID=2951803 RepID=UPI00352DC8DA
MDTVDAQAFQKFQKILRISKKVKIQVVAESLRLSTQVLFERLVQWGEVIPFKIVQDYIEWDEVAEQMHEMDRLFSEWENALPSGKNKTELPWIEPLASPLDICIPSPTLKKYLGLMEEQSKRQDTRHFGDTQTFKILPRETPLEIEELFSL